jgi:dienelactone hydrolase
MRSIDWAVLMVALVGIQTTSADEINRSKAERGSVRFEPTPTPTATPAVHRMNAHTFSYELALMNERQLTGESVWHLTFPSPVKSPYPENNTVHAEYYRPKGAGPFPAVIVLDILAGDQSLARNMAGLLAQNNIAALFVQMAYYGPRRPSTGNVRLLSMNIPRTLEAVRQSVLDCRSAAAWLASRPEIDSKKLGIVGTSLGSFIAALTAEAEPKLTKVALVLSGGGFVEGHADHPRAKTYLGMFEKLGITKEMMQDYIAPADPLTNAANLKTHDLLMIAAKRDDMVPPKMAEALWRASGQQKIVWFDTTHYGAALYGLSTFKLVLEHFHWQ